MEEYVVKVRCTNTDTWKVDADSPEDAIKRLRNYEGELVEGGESPETDWNTAKVIKDGEQYEYED